MRYLIVSVLIVMASCKSSDKNSEKEGTSDPVKFALDSIKVGDKIFSVDSVPQRVFEKIGHQTFNETEKNNLAQDSTEVKRSGDSLIIKLLNGKTATFVNREADYFSRYKYLGKVSSIGQYFVSGSFDEWGSNFLINETTGDTTEICGYPEVSPDHSMLISGNVDLIAEFSFNGIDLFSIENNSLKRIGKRELSGWGPKTIKWLNNQELLMEIRIFETDPSKNRLDRPGFIKLKMN